MNHSENVDHDAVLRARMLLLGSGRINIDESRTYLFVDRVRPLFDEGVALTRRLAEVDGAQGRAPLARALTDRSTLLIAGKQYGGALADFRAAVDLLDR
ncbi:hypothetical protein [Streptomyces sp. NPDC056452]|uniref:hypothetical protein n=1 Tax=Streptomyces sp. NPDC056452 TaxID=3345821 RepID=UPI00369A4373